MGGSDDRPGPRSDRAGQLAKRLSGSIQELQALHSGLARLRQLDFENQ
jgi:hypothetical protein